LVEENLAACANLIPSVSSIYRWENKLECSTEVFVLFKTTAKSYKIFEEKLKLLHPYDVPEVVAVTVSDGSATYLNWVLGNCSG
jgi:periplasmic divalent cation tolerance protein